MVGTALPVSATAVPGAFDFLDSSYILTMRSGGIETYAHIPRDLPQDVGHSFVDLIHDTGQERGRCETIGAGYWLSTEVEEAVLGAGAAPPDAGDVSGGYRNPTTSREVAPNLSPGENLSNKNPGVKNYFPPGGEVLDIPSNGSGPLWQATCDSDVKGSAIGDMVNVAGAALVGSTTQAAVDKASGVYTGTSRAYVVGLEGASGFDSMSSLMEVTNKANQKPTITFRMSFFNSDSAKAGSQGKAKNDESKGYVISGTDVPFDSFAEQFNAGAKAFTEAVEPAGPIGSTVLLPEVGVSTDGGRYSITISAAQGYAGSTAREGTAGERAGMRFGSVTFTGIYGNA